MSGNIPRVKRAVRQTKKGAKVIRRNLQQSEMVSKILTRASNL